MLFFAYLSRTYCSQRTKGPSPLLFPLTPTKKEKKKEVCFVTNYTMNHISELASASCLSWRANLQHCTVLGDAYLVCVH